MLHSANCKRLRGISHPKEVVSLPAPGTRCLRHRPLDLHVDLGPRVETAPATAEALRRITAGLLDLAPWFHRSAILRLRGRPWGHRGAWGHLGAGRSEVGSPVQYSLQRHNAVLGPYPRRPNLACCTQGRTTFLYPRFTFQLFYDFHESKVHTADTPTPGTVCIRACGV